MSGEDKGPPSRELYARLQVSPDATSEEIKKAYRQWAQVYHPDKYQDFRLKETATQNFQRICEAHEILTDEYKRQIYDIYGMEGLASGLELGPRLTKVEELKEELERLRRRKEQEKILSHIRPSGTIVANLSLPDFLDGYGIVKGMAMSSEVHSQLSKRNAVQIGGNLQVEENSGGGAANAVFRHQLSSVSSIEFVASAGLRSLIGLQTTRQLSLHSTATIAMAKSLKDGSINLSNTWTRRLSETANGHIQLLLGPESSVAVGWQKKDEKISATGELKIGTSSFGASAHYTHRFSSKSHGELAGDSEVLHWRLKLVVGGKSLISALFGCCILWEFRALFWRFELHRGGQKLIIPILLSSRWNPLFATGAFMIPTSLYLLLKKFIMKPYYLTRDKQKALKNKQKTYAQVQEARAAAEKAQHLMQNVANRKRNKQAETNGLVITKAVYGNRKTLRKGEELGEANEDSEITDVTTPLNFLVNDSGQLKLHEGVKKSGIMGFYDPCPGESKQLYVEYTYGGQRFEAVAGDFEELAIPQEAHRI